MSESFEAGLPRWIALASQFLRWTPDAFWRATPAELVAALADPERDHENPLTRSEFEQLLESERNGRND